MTEYIFTSKLFTGHMKFVYDIEGVICRFENNAVLSDVQSRFLTEHFPFVMTDLPRIVGKSGKIEESTDITFDTFWEQYGYKKGKQQAKIQWQKLNDGSKAKAIAKIKKYKYDCKTHSRDMVYAERYLKHRRFDDE